MATGTVFVPPGRSLGPDVQGHPGSCRRARRQGRHGSLIRISPHFHTSRTTRHRGAASARTDQCAVSPLRLLRTRVGVHAVSPLHIAKTGTRRAHRELLGMIRTIGVLRLDAREILQEFRAFGLGAQLKTEEVFCAQEKASIATRPPAQLQRPCQPLLLLQRLVILRTTRRSHRWQLRCNSNGFEQGRFARSVFAHKAHHWRIQIERVERRDTRHRKRKAIRCPRRMHMTNPGKLRPVVRPTRRHGRITDARSRTRSHDRVAQLGEVRTQCPC